MEERKVNMRTGEKETVKRTKYNHTQRPKASQEEGIQNKRGDTKTKHNSDDT